MHRNFLIAVRMAFATLVLTGILYPLTLTGLARVLFPFRAGGSVLNGESGSASGSELIGQAFENPAYLQPRPSAAGKGYDGLASSGSNLGPTSRKLRDRAERDSLRLRIENPEAPGNIPIDLVTASASGLDPHITPAAALWQADRIAKARNVSPERIRSFLEDHVEARTLWILGEPRVNVLLTNLALDRQFGLPLEGKRTAD